MIDAWGCDCKRQYGFDFQERPGVRAAKPVPFRPASSALGVLLLARSAFPAFPDFSRLIPRKACPQLWRSFQFLTKLFQLAPFLDAILAEVLSSNPRPLIRSPLVMPRHQRSAESCLRNTSKRVRR